MTQVIEPKHKNYHPRSMSFAAGFLGPRGNVGYFMVADYEKAKDILQNIIDSGRSVQRAVMGLDGDFDINSTEIFDGETHCEYDAYGSSSWAEPIMIVDFADGSNEVYSVWRNENELNQLP